MKLGVAIPSHQLGNVATAALLHAQRCQSLESFTFAEFSGSALALNHNRCWCWGLNEYRAGRMTHLLIMHSDVRPQRAQWLDTLIAEMATSQAEVLAAIIPLKEASGLTSTAFDTDRWLPVRLSTQQRDALPVTWTCDNLLVNTGLMLIDLSAPWADERIVFTMRDRIVRIPGGGYLPQIASEDWNFARDVRRHGGRLFVTRAVPVDHCGISIYPGDVAWGFPTDDRPADAVLITDAAGATTSFRPGPALQLVVGANGNTRQSAAEPS